MTRDTCSPRTLLGVETEYACTVFDGPGASLDRRVYLRRLIERVRAKMSCLSGGCEGDLYLSNGARLYIDAGLHCEYATPECSSPEELVAHVRAGDRIVGDMAAELQASDSDVSEVLISKCNVDYVTGTTWGSHESYLHRQSQSAFPNQIIPHLVSRIIYTGAGGFDNTCLGLEFLLSPRVVHLVQAISPNSQSQRGIFHTKQESLSGGGYRRLHLLSGESLHSETADYLRLGTTALVAKLVDAGLKPAQGMELRDPVGAMRVFAADPSCRAMAPLRGAGSVTALDLQQHYLEVVRARLDAPYMPDWAPRLCRYWEFMLDALRVTPELAAAMLDWPIKFAVFRKRAAQRGFAWTTIAHWNAALEGVETGARCFGSVSPTAAKLLQDLPPESVAAVRQRVSNSDLDWRELDAFLALRCELCEIDTRFSQLGQQGIFSSLDKSSMRSHQVVGAADIAKAKDVPPQATRAKRRGQWIARLTSTSSDYICDWTGIWNRGSDQFLDLRDPFDSEECNWQPIREKVR